MTRRSWVQAPHGTTHIYVLLIRSGVVGLTFNLTPNYTYTTLFVPLAQSGLERVAFNLVVVGSNPTGDTFSWISNAGEKVSFVIVIMVRSGWVNFYLTPNYTYTTINKLGFPSLVKGERLKIACDTLRGFKSLL
jgi:hypothetical protein